MSSHINRPNITISASTTHAEGTYPVGDNSTAITIYNPGTGVCFVKSGASTVVATSSCNFVPPASMRVFQKLATDTTISVLMSASTATILIVPCTIDGVL